MAAMPNGHDKNWYRLCGALDGFRSRYGRWPTRVCLPSIIMNDLRNLFAGRDFLTLTSKLQFVLDDARIVAADEDGGKYSYGDEGFPDHRPNPSAAEWLGVCPKPE